MLLSLLEGETATPAGGNQWLSYVLIGVLVVVLIVSMVLMSRRSKKREQEAQKLIDAVKPGNKVKTIGGICGIVVEVDPEEDTFVLETGSEASGKCFMKFVRQAILESDAVVDDAKTAKVKDEEPATAEETVVEGKEIGADEEKENTAQEDKDNKENKEDKE